MTDKRDANERLETIVALAEQIIAKAKAAQSALPQIVEPPERTQE
jgi:hypothetical protein